MIIGSFISRQLSGNFLKLLTNTVATVKKEYLNLTFQLTVMRSPKHAHKNGDVFLLTSRKATRWVLRWDYFVVCCFLRSTFGKKFNLSKKKKQNRKTSSLHMSDFQLFFLHLSVLDSTLHFNECPLFINTFSFVSTEYLFCFFVLWHWNDTLWPCGVMTYMWALIFF